MAVVSTRPGVVIRFPVKFPARVAGISPVVVTQAGATFTFSIDIAALNTALMSAGLVVRVTQVIAHLVALGSFDMIADVIPPSPSNPSNVAWNRGGITTSTGPLMTLIFATLGLASQAQKDAFLAAVALLPY